jgi:hypothetical protein
VIPQPLNPPCQLVDEMVSPMVVNVMGSQLSRGFVAHEPMEGPHHDRVGHRDDGSFLARKVEIPELTLSPEVLYPRSSAPRLAFRVVGVKQIPLPPRSPNLNAYAERRICCVKDEALSRLILFGERSLR